MRQKFQETVSNLFPQNENLVLLLGDIGVFSFRKLFEEYPTRAINMGIMEQATISFAAGLSSSGKIPIVHTITPFLIERPYEQLKVDFGYQNLCGKFISVGASYDYGTLGATHHSPGDVNAVLGLPGFDIFLPSTAAELEAQLVDEIPKNSRSYFRLTEGSPPSHPLLDSVRGSKLLFGGSSRFLVVLFGSVKSELPQMLGDMGHSVIYVNSITTESKRELNRLIEACSPESVLVIEPFYEGTSAHLFDLSKTAYKLTFLGVPRVFIHDYGTRDELDLVTGLDVVTIMKRVSKEMTSEALS